MNRLQILKFIHEACTGKLGHTMYADDIAERLQEVTGKPWDAAMVFTVILKNLA